MVLQQNRPGHHLPRHRPAPPWARPPSREGLCDGLLINGDSCIFQNGGGGCRSRPASLRAIPRTQGFLQAALVRPAAAAHFRMLLMLRARRGRAPRQRPPRASVQTLELRTRQLGAEGAGRGFALPRCPALGGCSSMRFLRHAHATTIALAARRPRTHTELTGWQAPPSEQRRITLSKSQPSEWPDLPCDR